MPMIIGANYEAPEAFSFMRNPTLQWMSEEEYLQATGLKKMDYKKYWEARNKWWAKALTHATDGKGLKANFTDSFKAFQAPDSVVPINNLLRNQGAWDKLNNITDGSISNGHIMAFDTETIGDFMTDMDLLDVDRFSKDQLSNIRKGIDASGITEIAFATKSLNSNRITGPNSSFVFGIDSKQRSWLEEALQKKVNGEALTNAEESSLERMSRYSTISHDGNVFTTGSVDWKGTKYTTVGTLNISNPDSIEDIQSGIETLSKLYSTDREQKISNIVEHISDFEKKSNQVVIGQNLPYDTRVIEQYHKMHGTATFRESFQYADSMYALRAYARENNTTVAEIVKQYNISVTNPRLGSLEALEEAITSSDEYTRYQAHNAYLDSVATLKVFDNKGFNIIERTNNLLTNGKPVEISLADSLVKINAQGNMRMHDFVVIDDQITTSYSPTNQYWKFVGTGSTEFEGLTQNIDGVEKEIRGTRNKFVARFQTVNGDNANLYKVFDNEGQFKDWINRNTSFVGLQEANIMTQTAIHNKDIARRVIDGFFDVNQVTRDNYGIDFGGFAELKKYHQAYSDLASLSEETVKSFKLKDITGHEITTAKQLMSNIAVSNNIDAIIDYANANNISSIQSLIRAPKSLPNLNTHQIGIYNYNTRIFMQEAFGMFDSNSEFFSEALQNIEKAIPEGKQTSINLQRTILLQQMQQDYLSASTTKIGSNIQYTIEDLNNVSVRTGKDAFINIDASDINKSSSKLQHAFKRAGDTEITASNKLFEAVDDLVDRGLLTSKDKTSLLRTHGSGKNSYALASSIVTHLNANTQDVRKQGLDFFIKAQNEIEGLNGDLSSLKGKKLQRYSIIQNKNHKLLSESATSVMSLAQGTMTDDLRAAFNKRILGMNGVSIVEGFADTFDNPQARTSIEQTLRGMHYDKESVEDFLSTLYKSSNKKASLARINRELAKEGKDGIAFAFYKSSREEGSAFALFTTQKNYANLMDQLTGLKPDASSRDVKNAIDGLASYFEIPYLDVRDIGTGTPNDKLLKDALGHEARTVLVKRSDGNLRYDIASLNIYRDKNGVFHGGIRDQGGSYVNIRPNFERAMYAVSESNYTSSNRSLNNLNTARLKEAAAPQMSGAFDKEGNLRKMHMFTQKDIDFAHMLNLDPGEGNTGLFDLIEEFATDDMAQYSKDGTATRAIRELYDAFNEEYKFVGPTKNGPAPQNLKNVKRVFETEQFKMFYQQNLTGQSGGIQSEALIARYIAKKEHEGEKSAIAALRDKSLIQIMQQATEESSMVDESLRKTMSILASSGLNSVGTESMMHHSHVFWGNYSIGENTNSRLSGLYRPTYAQQSNYRAYNLEGLYFDNPEQLSKSLGIHFGDIYTSKQYIDRIRTLESGGRPELLTSENITRRNIIGAVASISDTELQATRKNSTRIIENMANTKGLNKDVLANVYEEMMGSINTYEGKFYARPSLANQAFFTIGDTKNVVSNELHAIHELGTKEESIATVRALSDLIDKKVTSGDVIGYRYNSKQELSPIFYNGQTIERFTEENARQLFEEGKTEVVVSRQLEDMKLFVGQEKGTAETMTYFTAINPDEQLQQIKTKMHDLGFADELITDNLSKNIETLNQYTDAAFDVIAPISGSKHKVTVLMNNNINKHITDMPFDTKWNLIASEFAGSEKGFNDLVAIANDVKYKNGETLGQHLFYDKLSGGIMFDNPLDNGSVNALDSLVERLRNSEVKAAKEAVREIDAFAKGNFAFQSIQRQQMNTFQGQAFRMDARVYQTLVMQGGGFEKVNGQLVPIRNYTKSNGAELAEHIRSSITSGRYDRTISGVSNYKGINSAWSDIVRSRRGILAPRNETDMYLGVLESLQFRNNPDVINGKNILKIKMEDILENIPASGSSHEGYKNSIFKTDGEFSRFIKSYSQINGNNVNLDAHSNSFYVDFGRKIKYGEQEISGILLPFQHISTTSDQIFLGESTKQTISFFNTFNKAVNENPSGPIDLTDALDDLYGAYARELDTSDKMSLASKITFRMNMPNSAGALALDTIVPTLDIDSSVLSEINKLENGLAERINQHGLQDFIIKDINELDKLYRERSTAVEEQASKILHDKEILPLLNLTGKKEYLNYINGGLDKNGNQVIESAIMVGRQMYFNTEMDLGHIGHQILTDFYAGKEGITSFDSLSKLTGESFQIFEKNPQEEFRSFIDTFFKKFNDTDAQNWAMKTRYDIYDILSKVDSDKNIAASVNKLNKSIDEYISSLGAGATINGQEIAGLDRELTKQLRREFLTQVNEGFEEIGAKYAKEVGILGMTNRYPNFSQTGILPVRIFLDDNIKGNSVRFLGPQFSILQNLDFDGDNEFLKFLGNGGLLAKDEAEAIMMKTQFDYMNQFNRAAYSQAIEDSIKSYRIGDETAFKATLLENLDDANYKNLRKQFEESLNTDGLRWFKSLTDDTQKYVFDHSKLITEAYKSFDETLGASFNNADMIRAAIQARVAKEYIGNFSKPNLEIRNTMSYMLSLVEDSEENKLSKLLRINDLLLTFDNPEIAFETKTGSGTFRLGKVGLESSGLLTLLEQKGIDTKHVHDANKLNNSTAWREGVRRLFTNANGAEKANARMHDSAVDKLVEGSRKVLFSGAEQSNTEIVNDILKTELDDLLEQASKLSKDEIEKSGVIGKIYLRGLYEMSTMDNAYEGFVSTFRKTTGNNPNFEKALNALSNEDFDVLLKRHGKDFDAIYSDVLYKALMTNRTDDTLQVFGRAVRTGDLLAYQSENGPVGYIFHGVTKDNLTNNFIARFDDYDFATGKQTGKYKFVEGISIRDLNENIKRNPRTNVPQDTLLDLTLNDSPYKNINSRDLDNLTDVEQGLQVRARAAELSVSNKLNQLFEYRTSTDFADLFKNNTSSGIIIKEYSDSQINNIIGQIVGNDADVFVRKADTIEQYLQYGISHQYIQGSEDAKSLIRSINKEIAKHPRESIQRFNGDTPYELLHNYLNNDQLFSGDQTWLRRGIQNITISNQIDNAVNTRIATRNANIDSYAKKFYDSVQKDASLEDIAFKDALQSITRETQDTVTEVFKQLQLSDNANAEMMRLFNWEKFTTAKNQDFLIQPPSAKISKEARNNLLLKAKVGYGSYIGTEFGDIVESQRRYILDQELTDEFIGTLKEGSTEYYAAKNTRTLLQSYQATPGISGIDFTSADTLRTTYKVTHPELEGLNEEARQAAVESLKQAAKEQNENVRKKTLLSGIGESLKDMTPENKKIFKTGGLVLGGVAAAGLVGHALFNSNSEDNNVEVPVSVENSLGGSGGKTARVPKIKNKSDAEYDGKPSDAKNTNRMQKKLIAPPSIKPRRNIYHDAKSGFNFKVSAQSAQKLQAESYQRMSRSAGINNTTLNVNQDNSRITDNWLANKFAELTE